MEARLENLTEFMGKSKVQFVIPVYQRNYDWKEGQCIQLLKDIYQVAENDAMPSHFIGSIVFIQDGVYSTRKNILTIIDGQQRLTSLTLLLLATAHKALADGNESLAEEILDDYILNKRADEGKIKLRPVKKDDEALSYLIENKFDREYAGYSRIVENYKFFKSELANKKLELIVQGVEKLHFVEVSLERGKDDPQRIFESLNSTGLDLSQSDLIRNYVLMDIEPSEQTRIYDSYWVDIETNCLEEKSKQSRLSDFVRDYLTFKFRQIPPKNQVFQWFRQKYDFSSSGVTDKIAELESLLREMKQYSKYYGKFINGSDTNPKVQEGLRNINRLEVNTAFPFLLEVFADHEKKVIDDDALIYTLNLIQSYVWRRFICSLPTNSLNKTFMTLYQNIQKESYLLSLDNALVKKRGQQRFPNNGELAESLRTKDFYNIQAKNRIYFFERLENHGRNIPFQIEGNDKVTTEHILPQTPSKEWKVSLGDQLAPLHEKYLHTVANLTISGNNGELGNRAFLQKRDLPEFGYFASGLWLNQYLSTITNWNEEELLTRLQILVQRTYEIWPIPAIPEPERLDTAEINVFDLDDATNRKLEYFIFFEVKYDERFFIGMLKTVVATLFDLDADRFFKTDLQVKLKLTTDKRSLLQPMQISQSYYIEAKFSVNYILGKLRATLETFDLYDELFIKLIDE
ncbi:MAG TPA: DUF262 domain-containing protein [Pyrinomonadaceae bacterium]|nr:DUF262 domain-containing protein [Pyrinomonadaceae bacterium]